jgi:23S rRNA (guanine2445-N2)-methyltransferase / 23S rRNA (guanine2069-N7)-methyltransferase
LKTQFFATVAAGLEPLLADELATLGAEEIRAQNAGVAFTGDLACGYRICLWSRLASRVLLRLARFHAPDADALKAGIERIAWEDHLAPDGTFLVAFTGTSSAIRNTHFGALTVKDGVVDRFRARTGRRPSVRAERPDVRLAVHLFREQATVYLDLAGESLHRRAYRLEQGAAPLKESLAAAVLLQAGWPALAAMGGSLFDPLCGAGTLLIEGAWMAGDVAPGLLRAHFGFSGWLGHVPALWQRLRAEAEARRAAGRDRLPPMAGCDADERVLRLAAANAARAGLAGQIRFLQGDLSRAAPPAAGPPGLVASNPPYGGRLESPGTARTLHAALGARLTAAFGGWRAAVISALPDAGPLLGCPQPAGLAVSNGSIPCGVWVWDVATVSTPRAETAEAVAADDEAQALANRLRKNVRHLGRWARREGVEAYRLYDADLPEYAFAIDRYGDWLHVQEYAPPASVDPAMAARRRAAVLSGLPEWLDVPLGQVVFKTRERQRGRAQYVRQDAKGGGLIVREGGLRFRVNLTDYLDTGLFLDHRATRALLREAAAGGRFLNLFCYTGSATVYAAAGGAIATTSVDLSATYLDWARENLRLNDLDGPQHPLIQADGRTWIDEDGGLYDLIFLDPPTFSNSKRMSGTWDVQRDHAALIASVMARLAPGGQLVFSTNHRRFRLDPAVAERWRVEDLSRATLPPDFARNPAIRCLWRITCR